METIRNLREIRDNSTDKPNASGVDSAQIAELKGLRQKKDELELKMSGLQETRKELMSQLEDLMSILKVSGKRSVKGGGVLFCFDEVDYKIC